MRGHVELGDDDDAKVRSVLHDSGDVGRGVHTGGCEGALLGHVLVAGDLDGEGLVVGDVPVQDVLSVDGHAVHHLYDVGNGQEMTRRINHEPSEIII